MHRVRADHELVRAARQGDRAAFAELVERHYRLVLASCRRIVGDADLAHDAAQEAVLRALLGIESLREETRFASWLVGIGLNVCRERIAASSSHDVPLLALEERARRYQRPALADEPLEIAAASELAGRVRAAVARLPAGQRRAVALFYLLGMTHAEAAQQIGTRPGAVKTRLHKARTALRASLSDTYKEYTEMTEQATPWIPMHVAELRRTAGGASGAERHILFLEGSPQRRLPIWIGAAEATALAIILEDVELPRPGVYQFAAALLAGAGSRLHEVRITELTSATFYAQAILADGTAIDARPSDAVTLALLSRAPIYADLRVLEQADKSRAAIRDLLDQADAATDDAHVIAEEVNARLATAAIEQAAIQSRLE